MSHAWMPLYVADYLADTGHLSTLEHGAYMLLIMHYWQTGALPDDDRKLARIARMQVNEWSDIRDTMAEMFSAGWTHKRIDAELAHAEDVISKRSAAAKAMHAKRIADARRVARNSTAGADACAPHLDVQTALQSPSPLQEEAGASSAREPDVMVGDFPEAVVKRHRLALVAAFGGGASAPVDIGLFTTWVAAYGWDPEVIAATIMGHLGDAAKRAKGMKYWEKVVREVFEKRASAPAPPPKGPPPKPADPQEISAGRWLELLEMRRINGTWAAARYGPPPGDPGCLVPAEVLSLDLERNGQAA